MTVAIGTPEEMEARALEARAFSILKIKLGWDGDVAFVRRLRELTSQTIRVDANEAWTAAEAIDQVAELWADVLGASHPDRLSALESEAALLRRCGRDDHADRLDGLAGGAARGRSPADVLPGG